MSDFDRDSLFSDIDKIMEQQGYTNIVSSSTPVEVEASSEPVPEDQPAIKPHELDHIERVINPVKEPEVNLEPGDELNPEPVQVNVADTEPANEINLEPADEFPDNKISKYAEELPPEEQVVSFSSTPEAVVMSDVKPGVTPEKEIESPVGNEDSSKFTTIEKPMEWSLESETPDSAPAQPKENHTSPVSYLEAASSDGVQVENVAFGDISVGVETESVEFAVGHPLIRLFRNILIVIALALVISLFITKFIAHHTSVDGSSMFPTLTDGDQLIVEQFSYYFHDPERFDIVVFPISTEDDYIKRVIGLPGETVQILNGQVYINGNLLTEDRYGAELIQDPGMAADTIYLQPDEYFVLGDNRNASIDSRFPEVGLIKKKDFEGRAWLRFYPFGSFGSVN